MYSIGAFSILNLNLNAISDKINMEKEKKVEKEEISQPIRRKPIYGGRNFINNWR